MASQTALKLISDEMIQSLIASVQTAFKIQLETEVQISLRAAGTTKMDTEIVAVLNLASQKRTGLIGICFPEKTFLNMFNKMVGEAATAITGENADAACEIANIIYGNVRGKFNQSGNAFQPAIPTVIRGSKIEISHPDQSEDVGFNCVSSLGVFAIEFSLKARIER